VPGTKAEVNKIVKKIKEAQDAYYDGREIMSDDEFDALWDYLEKIDPDNAILHAVGADSAFAKTRHLMPMGSQNKARNEAEFRAWLEKRYDDRYVCEMKYDGASLELQYENGKLVKAVSRGDGVTGDDVTANALKMQGVVKKLETATTCQVRGEVMLGHKVFAKKYSDKKNCRNAAAGIMKRKDGEGCEDLTLRVYDARGVQFRHEKDKIDWLSEQGFIVDNPEFVDTTNFAIGFNEILLYRNRIDDARKGELDFDCDGIIVKPYKIFDSDDGEDRPTHQIAFKFDLDKAITKLVDVKWEVSGRNRCPVAILEPVELCGTTVKRATLCNPNEIKRLGVEIGCMVEVAKMGEIIPKILRVV
jgi:DNA ligase (NAD+)